MSPQTIYYYEDIYKEYIMKALLDEGFISLDQLVNELINMNPEDDKIIKMAFKNVKSELTGINHDIIHR